MRAAALTAAAPADPAIPAAVPVDPATSAAFLAALAAVLPVPVPMTAPDAPAPTPKPTGLAPVATPTLPAPALLPMPARLPGLEPQVAEPQVPALPAATTQPQPLPEVAPVVAAPEPKPAETAPPTTAPASVTAEVAAQPVRETVERPRAEVPAPDPAAALPAAAPAPVAATAHAAPTAPVQAPPPAAHAQVVKAVVALVNHPTGDRTVQLQLAPAELGTVHVTVDLRGGEVSVHLHAVEAATGDLLRDSLRDLRTQLEELGVRTGGLDVASGSLAGQGDRQQQWEHRGSPPSRGRPGGLGAVVPPQPQPDPAQPAGALDLRL